MQLVHFHLPPTDRRLIRRLRDLDLDGRPVSVGLAFSGARPIAPGQLCDPPGLVVPPGIDRIAVFQIGCRYDPVRQAAADRNCRAFVSFFDVPEEVWRPLFKNSGREIEQLADYVRMHLGTKDLNVTIPLVTAAGKVDVTVIGMQPTDDVNVAVTATVNGGSEPLAFLTGHFPEGSGIAWRNVPVAEGSLRDDVLSREWLLSKYSAALGVSDTDDEMTKARAVDRYNAIGAALAEALLYPETAPGPEAQRASRAFADVVRPFRDYLLHYYDQDLIESEYVGIPLLDEEVDDDDECPALS